MIQSRIRATDYVAIVNAPEATIVRCCAGTKGSLFIGLAGAQRPALRPDDLVQLLCHTAPVTGLGIGFLDERDSRDVDFRAFPHLVCLSIIGCGAEHILRNLARRDEDSAESPSGRAVCPELKKLIVYFEFEVEEKADGLQLGPLVKGEHKSTIEADFRERCAELERILTRRAEMGTRVTGLEFGYTERTQPGSEESEAGHIRTLPTNLSNVWRTCGPILEPLRKLVDGPVVVQDYGDDW